MTATCVYVKEPAVSILENIYIFVGHLPKQVVEIFFGFGSRDFLIYGNATNRLFTLTAFLIGFYFTRFLSFQQFYLIPCIHTPFP
jgi:hypothetical protein